MRKIFYGFLFVALLPALLVIWAHYTEFQINLPVPSGQISNLLLLLSGIFFLFAGMHNLWFYGKGLPMNAFPPKKFVTRGVYAISKNPIYLGSVILSFAVSGTLQSASGFWLVSPLFALMIIAYTVGFENERNVKVFGNNNYRPFLSLPEASTEPATLKNKISAYFIAYLPWLLAYEAFIFIGAHKDAIVSNFPFELQLPVIESSAFFYFATYLYAILVPFVVQTKISLRRFETDIWLSTGIAAMLYFVLPFIVKQHPFTPHTVWGKLLLIDRAGDGIGAAFPSFHVIWAFISARYFSVAQKKRQWIWYTLAVFMSASCITTGNHSIIDVVSGIAVFIIVTAKVQIWNFIRFHAERIANSWKEWHFGPIRVINHGLYAGLAGFVGILFVGLFLGGMYAVAGFITGLFGIVGAALWAQFIEGSPKLQRPYGYYGSVLGVIVGALFSSALFNVNIFLLFASFAMAAPWIQIPGRLRCLVQGCCHGKPTNDKLGIRFTHHCSRVNKISGMLGASLHPTQLYSIGTNFFTGIVLIRLYTLNMSATFIVGIYLILNGIGRFVEEYFRGEAQTPYWMEMRIYQWISIINILIGAIFTCLPSATIPFPSLNVQTWAWALAMGIVATIAYGVDFPRSNRRFARLTSA